MIHVETCQDENVSNYPTHKKIIAKISRSKHQTLLLISNLAVPNSDWKVDTPRNACLSRNQSSGNPMQNQILARRFGNQCRILMICCTGGPRQCPLQSAERRNPLQPFHRKTVSRSESRSRVTRTRPTYTYQYAHSHVLTFTYI